MEAQTLKVIYTAVWDSEVALSDEQVSTKTGIPLSRVREGLDILVANKLIRVANIADLRYGPATM